MSEVWADRDRRRRRCMPVLVAAAFAGIGGEFFRAFRYLVFSSTWRHAAHRIAFLPRVTIPCKLLDWGWIKNAVNLHDADPLIDQLEMKKVEKEDSIGLAEPKRSKVERTANKLTTARPSNARSTMAKPRTTRFRPKNRKQPRTTRPFTFYEMTERHVNVVVPDGPEPINEEGVSLVEESESSHLSRLLSSDGKDKAPISTDQTNFEGT
ncbi:hypothetical protein LOK49_Contig45G00013 [Camellia lanceoleosa]|nr:hypothetical protein LOK49_Contig45G00013 [Camellia lanceoleosa]